MNKQQFQEDSIRLTRAIANNCISLIEQGWSADKEFEWLKRHFKSILEKEQQTSWEG